MLPEAEYSRGIHESSMILTTEKSYAADQDSIEMFRYNEIPCFLKMHMQEQDDKKKFCYDITSKRSLGQILEYRLLNDKILLKILHSFDQACIQTDHYLLAENDILLKPEMIFLESESEQILYCYLPGNQEDICSQFRELMEYLLQHLDHKNEQAVQLAYGVYQCFAEEGISLHDVLKDFRSGNMIMKTEKSKKEKDVIHSMQNAPSVPSVSSMSGKSLDELQGQLLSGQEAYVVSGRANKPVSGSSVQSVSETAAQSKFGAVEQSKPGVVVQLKSGVAVQSKSGVAVQTFSEELEQSVSVSKQSAKGIFRQPAKDLSKQREAGKKRKQRLDVSEKHTEMQSEEASKLNQKEAAKKQAGEKLRNLLRRKLYTNGYRNEEEETIFEEEVEDTLSVIHPTVCIMNETEGIQNQFIYQGTDRTRDFYCTEGNIILGSNHEECDICIPLPMVSRVHARIEINAQGTFLEDMNSTNGTQINGELLEYRKKYMLNKGDTISLAGENYSFH